MPNYARAKSWQQLVKSSLMTPKEKLRAAAKREVGRKQVRARKAKLNLIDPSKHGAVLSTPYFRGKFPAPLIAAEWSGADCIVTVPWHVPRCGEWPAEDSPAGHEWRRDLREGARQLSIMGLRASAARHDFGYDTLSAPYLPGLKPLIESVGFVRLVPKRGKFFDVDSLFQWFHQMRDGIYDTWAGLKYDKNGKAIWLGQVADHDYHPDFVQCQYNQLHSDGYGVKFVFRFREDIAEALQRCSL